MEELENTTRKTWSREVSVFMLAGLGYLAYTGATGPLSILVWPFMLFITASFGLKQESVSAFMSK